MNLRRISSLLLLVSLWLMGTLLSVNAAPPAQGGDYELPNGHFYTQTANGQGGFSVVNDSQARFFREFQRLGGLQTVGYPISRRYEKDGFVTQAFQKLVLQWRPEVRQALPVNVFDELSKSGFNQRLLQTRQIPLPLNSQFDSPNASWAEIVAKRQGLLNANSAIRAGYFSVSDPLTVFGLPTSPVQDMGNHYAIRTQRAVFQQWKENVPWAQAGQVTIANGGDIAKELGWLPQNALVPEPDQRRSSPPAATTNSRTPIRTLLVGPGTPSRLYALTRNGALLISDNLGQSWRSFAGSLPVRANCLHDVNMDYATLDALYASTCQGLYRWEGARWRKISSQETQKVAVVYGQPQNLWGIGPMGNRRSVIIRSHDGGVTWNAADIGIPREPGELLDIAVDPSAPTTLYAIRNPENGPLYLARGNNSGQWSVLPASNQFLLGAKMAIDGATGDLYFTDQQSGLWYTRNPKVPDGHHIQWQQLGNFNDYFVEVLATGKSPNGELAIYVNLRTSRGGQPLAAQSLDGGRTWNLMNLPLEPSQPAEQPEPPQPPQPPQPPERPESPSGAAPDSIYEMNGTFNASNGRDWLVFKNTTAGGHSLSAEIQGRYFLFFQHEIQYEKTGPNTSTLRAKSTSYSEGRGCRLEGQMQFISPKTFRFTGTREALVFGSCTVPERINDTFTRQ